MMKLSTLALLSFLVVQAFCACGPDFFTGTLKPGESVRSPNGKWIFINQADGNVVMYRAFWKSSTVQHVNPFWHTATNRPDPGNLQFTSSGNLVLYDKSGRAIKDFGIRNGVKLKVHDNGHFYVYDASDKVVWNPFMNKNLHSLVRGEYLLPGSALVSPNGIFALWFHFNGNLDLVNLINGWRNRIHDWQSHHIGNPRQFFMQGDGNLVAYFHDRDPWHTSTHGTAANRLTLQDDGNLVLYGNDGKAYWHTITGRIVNCIIDYCHNHAFVVSGTYNANNCACGKCLDNFFGSRCDTCAENYEKQGCLCVAKTCAASLCNGHGQVSGNLADNSCRCTCTHPYTGQWCDYCVKGYQKNIDGECAKIILDCQKDFCNYHGTVLGDQSVGCKCQCAAGYEGLRCETKTPCTTSKFPCDQGTLSGTIVDGCVCSCHTGYQGENCQAKIPCSASYCNDHGTVAGTILDGCTCSNCAQNYVLPTCTPRKCDASDCNNRATTVTGFYGACHCTCEAKYVGSTCELCDQLLGYVPNDQNECVPKKCADDYCNGQGTVTGNVVDGCTCTNCHAGYTGMYCNTKVLCSSSICNNHGTPSGTVVDGCQCSCAHGYEGSTCQTKTLCPDSFCSIPDTVYGTIVDGCHCEGCTSEKHCNGRATEVSEITGACKCTCSAGYSGSTCQLCAANYELNKDTNQCEPQKCDLAADCNGNDRAVSVSGNRADGCQCDCKVQYSGPSCAACAFLFEGEDCHNAMESAEHSFYVAYGEKKMTQTDAIAFCNAKTLDGSKGYLASILSTSEADAVRALSDRLTSENIRMWWLGATSNHYGEVKWETEDVTSPFATKSACYSAVCSISGNWYSDRTSLAYYADGSWKFINENSMEYPLCVFNRPTCASADCKPGAKCVFTPLPAGTVCRPSRGGCDPDERCNGVDLQCPQDELLCGTLCREVHRPYGLDFFGTCDVVDRCSNGKRECTDFVQPMFTLCGPSLLSDDEKKQLPCFKNAYCTGSHKECIVEFWDSSKVCRPSTGPCDVEERCDGHSMECPPDNLHPPGRVCNTADPNLPCDTDDVCEAGNKACPAKFKPSTHVCRAREGLCDTEETCTGSSGECPPDALRLPGEVCNPASNHPCDADDVCEAGNKACPAKFKPSTHVCRAKEGPCDVEETCTGSSGECPTDGLQPVGTICNAADPTLPCDADDVCEAGNKACPAKFKPSTHVCRAKEGPCDVEDTCTGESGECPTDGLQPVGTICNAADPTLPCDVDDVCEAGNKACPAKFKPATHVCKSSSGLPCDAPDMCSGFSTECVRNVQPETVQCAWRESFCESDVYCDGVREECGPNKSPCGECDSCYGSCCCATAICQKEDGTSIDVIRNLLPMWSPVIKFKTSLNRLETFNAVQFAVTLIEGFVNDPLSKWPKKLGDASKLSITTCEVIPTVGSSMLFQNHVCGSGGVCAQPDPTNCPTGVRACSCPGSSSGSRHVAPIEEDPYFVFGELTFALKAEDVYPITEEELLKMFLWLEDYVLALLKNMEFAQKYNIYPASVQLMTPAITIPPSSGVCGQYKLGETTESCTIQLDDNGVAPTHDPEKPLTGWEERCGIDTLCVPLSPNCPQTIAGGAKHCIGRIQCTNCGSNAKQGALCLTNNDNSFDSSGAKQGNKKTIAQHHKFHVCSKELPPPFEPRVQKTTTAPVEKPTTAHTPTMPSAARHFQSLQYSYPPADCQAEDKCGYYWNEMSWPQDPLALSPHREGNCEATPTFEADIYADYFMMLQLRMTGLLSRKRRDAAVEQKLEDALEKDLNVRATILSIEETASTYVVNTRLSSRASAEELNEAVSKAINSTTSELSAFDPAPSQRVSVRRETGQANTNSAPEGSKKDLTPLYIGLPVACGLLLTVGIIAFFLVRARLKRKGSFTETTTTTTQAAYQSSPQIDSNVASEEPTEDCDTELSPVSSIRITEGIDGTVEVEVQNEEVEIELENDEAPESPAFEE